MVLSLALANHQVSLLLFLTPVLNSQGMKKLRYAIQKVQKITLE